METVSSTSPLDRPISSIPLTPIDTFLSFATQSPTRPTTFEDSNASSATTSLPNNSSTSILPPSVVPSSIESTEPTHHHTPNLKLIIPLSSIAALALISGLVVFWFTITRRKKVLYPYPADSIAGALVKDGSTQMKPREGTDVPRTELVNDARPVHQSGHTSPEGSQQQLLVAMLQRLAAVEEAVRLPTRVQAATTGRDPVTMNDWEDQPPDYISQRDDLPQQITRSVPTENPKNTSGL